ncbi:hypothetical protein HNR02_005305 [Amycolatopsis endophytica]|uniref:Uncharacterized protein n=1 Tax=Amycolatopsis endophytica TaxID=860233 RepID=A0A853BAC2_9PSEU|nr:DUF6098 family protein [Amycolatopsis endophytica]NYI91930.1 hypothetical protein [Amycolatopsis endophytica]
MAREDSLPTLRSLADLAQLLIPGAVVYVRYSPGPESDVGHPSTDHESGLRMPGVSVNPLNPPGWWSLPVEDWLARRICQYLHQQREGARPWVLGGTEVDFGPDNEPLLVDVEPIAWIADELVTEARERYHSRLDAGASTHED